MELYMQNIDFRYTKHQVTEELAKVIHGPYFSHFSQNLNFHVHLHPDKQRVRNHNGRGFLTLPTAEVGRHFMNLYGSDPPRLPLMIGKGFVSFSISKNKPEGRPDVVERIRLQPYIDPKIAAARDEREAELNKARIPIISVQFGWECRDFVFSIECEERCEVGAGLTFSAERREIRVNLSIGATPYYIALSYPTINTMHVHNYLGQEPCIVFILNTPPTYETQHPNASMSDFITPRNSEPKRRRLSYLPISRHDEVAQYTSLALRLVCSSPRDLDHFRRWCNTAGIHHKSDTFEYPVEKRNIFSKAALDDLRIHLRRLNWIVAFQVVALIQDLSVDVQEILRLVPFVYRLVNKTGKAFTAMVLRKFRQEVVKLYWEENVTVETVIKCFRDTATQVAKSDSISILKPTDGSLCDAYHVKITPTTILLDGPFPERSNRVIRAYDPVHQESFLRVSFVDEAKLSYRFDREIDGTLFIRERVGPILKNELIIAGRKFYFLAYSQSALKEHSVWFVKPFKIVVDGRPQVVDASSIIQGLGNFHSLSFDTRLIYCPARYAARLSQAFTATDAVEIAVEEIIIKRDITTVDEKYQFTDGVGTMSKELAREIWARLKQRKANKPAPGAYQIRYGGAKGMLSVDHTLTGLAMCLRDSMLKFDTVDSNVIEIARAFDRPGAYYLNRPLIMLLENLGVPYDVFKAYQDSAVRATQAAVDSLEQAAHLFETHGLGASFRLPSVMLSLHKLSIDNLPEDMFYKKVLEYGINHILRDLKNHARIPVPNAWTLVGVADVHRYLQPEQIFACIKPIGGKTIYLEGPVLISRSPTIHPGDVKIVHAIGAPPAGSCFAIEPLANTVVFSVLGDRPIPSCLGGGDLDGDVYNLIPLKICPRFLPEKLCKPADYDPAPKKYLNRPSTMSDVADFVMEYINSDVVGIVAINWLIIADQSDHGIFDPDCMKLANLHSHAVDYPKSGEPVQLDQIPKLKSRTKPDWNAPETVSTATGNYYESQRAIGKLFRAIDLPVERDVHVEPPRRRRTRGTRQRDENELARAFDSINLGDGDIVEVIKNHVYSYLRHEVEDAEDVNAMVDLYDRYVSELNGICMTNTLSHARDKLTEEEAVVGTIIQKTSQPRKRKDAMAKLRESTDLLVRAIRDFFVGDETMTHRDHLRRAWCAYELSLDKKNEFGAKSFGWVALGAAFEAIRNIEEELKEMGY
ncbi:hypothetical protein D9613_001948 [Agrocybe pediades]|uniref:RNA-dependent RNA polymerase n=1 Tax=Agrocybe pediades TaxID=84607 RepID=A0A8H4R8F1_9AGAR|nr:hypothetical protein D9613_001948 [Agrocybe pediades]